MASAPRPFAPQEDSRQAARLLLPWMLFDEASGVAPHPVDSRSQPRLPQLAGAIAEARTHLDRQMDFEPSYGSSEYSAEAEELFAQFLLKLEQGSAPEFEEFCADHEDWSDELYGLHADWDNVRGLLAQLEGKREQSGAQSEAAAPEPVEAQEAPEETATSRAEEFEGLQPTEASSPAEPPSGGAPWRALAVAGIIGALGLGLWAYLLRQDSIVLAQEKDALIVESEQTQQKLNDALETGEELEATSLSLKEDLHSTRSAKQELEAKSEDLARNLEDEKAAKSTLEEDKQALAVELSQEREAKRAAAIEADYLAQVVEALQLAETEAALWPNELEQLAPLEAWLDRATELSTSMEALRNEFAALPGARVLDDHPVTQSADLDRRIAHTRARLQQLKGWETEFTEAWTDAIHDIADATRSPSYDGLELVPQFPLVPLGIDETSGLWTFADLQTGPLPAAPTDDAVAPTSDFGNEPGPETMIFHLVPGIELEGGRVEAFFMSQSDCSDAHRKFALGHQARLADSDSTTDRDLDYSLDLKLMGYSKPSATQQDLARQSKLKLADESLGCVRSLQQAAE